MQTALQPDDHIKKDVFDRLYWDARITDFSNIDVGVSGGKVILEGSVQTFQARRYAERDAMGVKGVKSVDNRLAIKYSGGLRVPSDLDVARNIENIIRWNSVIAPEKMRISVNGGFVTLEGIVHSYYQKFRAEELTSDVIGVTRIENRLAVVPLVSYWDEYIAERIVTSLSNRLGRDVSTLTVMVKEGAVTLTGTLPDRITGDAIENILRHMRGIVAYHNLCAVGAAPKRSSEPAGMK
jgi:osmotically-inducible protein OsmY